MKTRGAWRSRHPALANVVAVAIAALLVGFPAYGVWRDDFAVPVGQGDGRYYHFHGAEAWLMFAGFACVGASILIVVARRLNGEPDGKTGIGVAEILALAGVFVILGMMMMKTIGIV
jgi:hypothetical protein